MSVLVYLFGGPRDGEFTWVPDHAERFAVPGPMPRGATAPWMEIANVLYYHRVTIVCKAGDFVREYDVYVHGDHPTSEQMLEIARKIDEDDAHREDAARDLAYWQSKRIFVPICDCDSEYCHDGFSINYDRDNPQGEPDFSIDSLHCIPTREHLVKIHEAIGKWLEETEGDGGE
ncbi:hypothetical protein SEA_REYNAULD_81 [Rhodococcus phage Reynauld]|uniref:Uncharacterized protein n=1 Tax=Rhodococcus phage Reynauld TaxID=3062845 RepID=A0ACD4UH98_9CAUD|nr:hypothetical protein SEA_REYNAULD_81 [Rhodococcus phage Reynauld]